MEHRHDSMNSSGQKSLGQVIKRVGWWQAVSSSGLTLPAMVVLSIFLIFFSLKAPVLASVSTLASTSTASSVSAAALSSSPSALALSSAPPSAPAPRSAPAPSSDPSALAPSSPSSSSSPSASPSFSSSSGQIVVKNSEKPENKKAGRIVRLEEVMRIEDDGKNFILRNPHDFSFFPDGSFIFFDFPYIYKLDKDGKVVFKALKTGQGPGECEYPDSYFIDGNRLVVHAWVPPKVLEYDLNGKFIKEKKLKDPVPLFFLGFVNGRIYGVVDMIRFSNYIYREGTFKTPYELREISPDFKNMRKIYDIEMEHYIKPGHWSKLAMFEMIPYDHFLFYVHSARYEIVKFDLATERVERIFSRPYAPVKISEEGEEEPDPYEHVSRELQPPSEDYLFDLQRLQVFQDTLWVKTSTEKDDGQKWQIDVFDLDGKYIDSFWLEFPKKGLSHLSCFAISNDGFIYVTEENQDTGLINLVKYKLAENEPKK